MTRQDLYRAALRLKPSRDRDISRVDGWLEETQRPEKLARLLRAHKTVGAAFAVFDGAGLAEHLVYGDANRGIPVAKDTYFRLASISKMLTALGALKLREEGRVDLDADVSDILPFSVRHPGATARAITLKMLLSHTSGLHDGRAYLAGMREGLPVTEVLKGDSYARHLPGERWAYSNLGAGLAGSVLEAATGLSFERLMQCVFFEPLGLRGSFYPQRVEGPLADAFRVMPPGRRPAFDAQKRRLRPCPDADEPAPERHYLLAQGACCAPVATVIGALGALMGEGYLSKASRRLALEETVPFGDDLPGLHQGLGVSLFQASGHRTVAGHQGHAYGAVHGAFFDPALEQGMVFLSSGTSEARTGFVADINRDLLSFCIREGYWQTTR